MIKLERSAFFINFSVFKKINKILRLTLLHLVILGYEKGEGMAGTRSPKITRYLKKIKSTEKF